MSRSRTLMWLAFMVCLLGLAAVIVRAVGVGTGARAQVQEGIVVKGGAHSDTVLFTDDQGAKPGTLVVAGHFRIRDEPTRNQTLQVYIDVFDADGERVIQDVLTPFEIKVGLDGHRPGYTLPYRMEYSPMSPGKYKVRVAVAPPGTGDTSPFPDGSLGPQQVSSSQRLLIVN